MPLALADASSTLLEFGSLGHGLSDNENSIYGQFLDNLDRLGYPSLLDAEFDDMSSFDKPWQTATTSDLTDGMLLRFLESFTREQGFVKSFECGTEAQRLAVYESLQADLGSGQLDAIYSVDSCGLSIPPRSHFDVSYLATGLAHKTNEIVSLVHEVVTVKPRNSAVSITWSTVLQGLCIEFFSPRRLQLYLGLYWTLWHPNVNFMHRPTFDAAKAKAILVAAMAIIGASISPNKQDNEDANIWFNCIEEALFRDDDFCLGSDGENASPGLPSEGRLQAVQAAYMVCLYQNWEGTDSSKRRIRRFRYSTLVAVVRDIGIKDARHPVFDHSMLPSFSWTDFVLREQLIRTFLWVFLLDTAFVIFNNAPPRMAIREMKMHFASSEDSFNASTSEECFRQLTAWHIDRPQTFSEASQRMAKSLMSSQEQTALASLGPLNLFGLVSALHSMIFQIQQLPGLNAQITPVQNVLTNWKMAWLVYSESGNEMALAGDKAGSQRIGFYRHCSEYWLLAKLITDRICASSLQSMANTFTNLKGAAGEDSADVKSEEAVLDDYDQTSMAQVNALISQFQSVGL